MLLERVLYAHGVAGDLETTIIRPFKFIGSRIDYLVPANAIGGPRVFPHFMSALLTGGPIRLVDGGYVRRAFMHIEDANTAFQAILDCPGEARNQIYNVGNPENDLTIRGVAQLMIELYEELTGRPARSPVVAMSGEEFYGPGYEDSSRLPPDISKLRSLGWAPRHGLRSTFRDAICVLPERHHRRARGCTHGTAVHGGKRLLSLRRGDPNDTNRSHPSLSKKAELLARTDDQGGRCSAPRTRAARWRRGWSTSAILLQPCSSVI